MSALMPVYFRGDIHPWSEGEVIVTYGIYEPISRDFVDDMGDFVTEVWVPTEEYVYIEQSNRTKKRMRVYVRQ